MIARQQPIPAGDLTAIERLRRKLRCHQCGTWVHSVVWLADQRQAVCSTCIRSASTIGLAAEHDRAGNLQMVFDL